MARTKTETKPPDSPPPVAKQMLLWDLLPFRRRPRLEPPAQPKERRKVARADAAPPPEKKTPMQDRYDAIVVEMKARYGIRINRWRQSMSGCAWAVEYRDGSVSRLIETPYPKGPMSAAVFLHEVGHHAIGLKTYSPRCLEEYHAWAWSLNTMREHGLNVTPAVEKRMADSLRYAIAKAARRGLKRLPVELEPYWPAAR